MSLLLKNGSVYDGSLNEAKTFDIYIENGIIKQIGKDLNVENVEEIDCSGLVVAPGFIDAHSHNDFFVKEDNIEDSILPFIKQGITTQVVGNCGFSVFGTTKDSSYNDLVGGGLFKCSNPGNLNEFENEVKGKLIQNIVPLIGHGTTRISVAGTNHRKLTKDELKNQLEITEDALKSGAYGGSFGLMYVPGMYAPKEELVEFAKVIAKYDGILTIHTRANSKVALGYSLIGKPHIEQALDEVIEIMKESNVRVEYSHLIFVGSSSWKSVNPMLKKFKKARKQGYEIAYDIYPFTSGASVITVVLPSWYLKLTPEERKKPFNKFKLKLIINITKKLLGIDFSDMVISYISPNHKDYEGKTVAQVAQEENLKPLDAYLKLVDLSDGKGGIMLGKYYNEDIILKLMNDDLSIYMTDAWYVDAGSQNAGTYQAFPFFIQKTRENNIKLENTIHKMTGATADRFKIENRGYIKEGYAADITIFNYENVQINQKVPNDTPKGIKYVIVNGKIVINNNQYTGIKNGVMLKKTV